jgi:hypothetical protein
MTPPLRFFSVLAAGFALSISGSSRLAAQTPTSPQLPAPAAEAPAESRQLEQLQPQRALSAKASAGHSSWELISTPIRRQALYEARQQMREIRFGF